MRAHQKDSYFESVLRDKVQGAVQVLTGQRFIHTHPDEITVAAKALYVGLTTVLGSRTLGEEYTDLMYVTRDGKRIPKLLRRLGFLASYSIIPYVITRILRRLLPVDEGEGASSKKNWFQSLSYSKILDTLLNVHLALFYFNGAYYDLAKRIFGLRYAFGHKVDKEEQLSRGGYELLGGLIFTQIAFKAIKHFSESFQNDRTRKSNTEVSDNITGVPPSVPSNDIDLSNPKLLKFIPDFSRNCMLCLSPMTNPSCAPCGHLFCWNCISDWSRDHPECPLCRQALTEQSILPLR